MLKALKHSSGNYSLILQGLVRIRMEHVTQAAPYLKAHVSRLDEPKAEDVEAEALAMSLRDIAKQVIQLMPELPREAGSLIDSIQAPGPLADLVAANLDAPGRGEGARSSRRSTSRSASARCCACSRASSRS